MLLSLSLPPCPPTKLLLILQDPFQGLLTPPLWAAPTAPSLSQHQSLNRFTRAPTTQCVQIIYSCVYFTRRLSISRGQGWSTFNKMCYIDLNKPLQPKWPHQVGIKKNTLCFKLGNWNSCSTAVTAKLCSSAVIFPWVWNGLSLVTRASKEGGCPVGHQSSGPKVGEGSGPDMEGWRESPEVSSRNHVWPVSHVD